MNASTKTLCGAAVVAVLLAPVGPSHAGPNVGSPEVQRALAQAEQGPDALRRFVERTRMIYALDYREVMLHHLATKAAAPATASDGDGIATQQASAGAVDAGK